MPKKITTEDFIKKSNKIHNEKYDYSKTIYINKRTKVTIICPIHGEFKQLPNNHTNGQGCPICGKEKCKENNKPNYGGVISLSKQRFNDEYEFPLIKEEYKNSHSIITIKHKKCGTEFKKIAGDHLTSKYGGCPCLRKYEKPKIQNYNDKIKKFLDKSKTKFNDSYEYPNIYDEFENYKSTITIKHKNCGNIFKIKISSHLDSKNGRCPCFNKIKKVYSKEGFEQSFNKINKTLNYKFNCDIESYSTQNTPINFYCKECGKYFLRKPTVFIYMNHTCPHCNGKSRNRTYTTEEFIEKAISIHKNKYDYSKVEYKHTDEKVCVICHNKDEFGEEHGEFYVTPHSHIGHMKSGCPKCSQKFGNKERFIKLANLKFNNFYNYSKVEYKNALTDVTIICPTHGEFFITPNEHLCGRGCPHCQESSLEHEVRTILIENKINFEFQKRFDWLKPLSLDFYLPKYNIAIECQGEQHFKPINFFGGEEKFNKIINNDKIKNELCNAHGINIIYYSNLNINYPYEVITEKKDLIKKLII